MLLHDLEKLIKSLSGSEKKYFQLHSEQLKGDKDYVALYKLIVDQKNGDSISWQQRFKENYPSSSLENTVGYLYSIVTDLLVQTRIEQDTWYQQYHSLMKARLCFERSIPSRAFKELQKAANLAAESQNHATSYQAARMELTALADMGFPGLSEQQLVDKQMKTKHTLQSLRQIQEYYSLYELLSHRLGKGRFIKSDKHDKQVNDLILSELSLSTRGSQHQFEPQRLHLLFQSFFFIHTGDYRSALRMFNELTKLIEANEPMWDYPPYDYLSALDGILDSLRSIGYYEEMGLFIEKIQSLCERTYPDHFRSLALLTAQVYHLNMLLGMWRLTDAVHILETFKSEKPRKMITGSHEKQLEYLYLEGLANFLSRRWQEANKCLNHLLSIGKQNTQLPVYRAGRLLHILLRYEQDDMEYLEYEIRSYKRAFSTFGKAFKTEKLIFNTINADPKRRGNTWKATTYKKTAPKLAEIQNDKRELQLLKFYDYRKWVMGNYQ